MTYKDKSIWYVVSNLVLVKPGDSEINIDISWEIKGIRIKAYELQTTSNSNKVSSFVYYTTNNV